MKLRLFLITLCWAQLAASADRPGLPLPTSLPPSALLHYTIRADRSGITLNGEATVNWQLNNVKPDPGYTINTQTRAALFGKILETDSRGLIDQFGLAPLEYDETPRNKGTTKTSFSRDAHQISFSESTETYALRGGEQDRGSVVWQLISQARATPAKMTPKSSWRFFVAGRRDAENWTFTVADTETITTGVGKVASVHLVRTPPPDSKDQRLDVWLAPELEWYPVRIKFSDADGDTIDQRLDQIKKSVAQP